MGSIGQRATKLPAIKLWEWFDPGPTGIRANRFDWGWGWSADFFLRPSTLKAGNFEALSSTDSIFTLSKDLNLLKSILKIKRLAAFWGRVLPCQIDLNSIVLFTRGTIMILGNCICKLTLIDFTTKKARFCYLSLYWGSW